MKNKILFLIIAAVGALLITASNGFSKQGYGENLNDACAPFSPYTTNDCNLCHDNNAAKDAYSAGGTTSTDYFCPGLPPACNDNDGDGYTAEGGDCGPSDCDDNDEFINPDAKEICTDDIDNDCDGLLDGADVVECPADSCGDYKTDRNRCKADPRCIYVGKMKECFLSVVYDQSECEEAGGRWNRKKGCSIRY